MNVFLPKLVLVLWIIMGLTFYIGGIAYNDLLTRGVGVGHLGIIVAIFLAKLFWPTKE